jgi:TolB protein
MPKPMRQSPAIASLGIVLALLVSCDKLPTGPTPPPPPPTVQRSTGPIAFVSNRDGTDRIYLANEDGSMVTPLVTGWDPAWAKDGRQIAFHVVGAAIRVINVDGSGERFIVGGVAPAWSPDGRSLVFENAHGDSEIDVVNLDGSNRRSVFDSDSGSFGPTWSPDGQQILFSIGTFFDSEFGLWTVNADGSGARQLGVRGSLYDAGQPAWSPDGSEIAFRSEPGLDIEVARTDGSGRRLLAAGPAHDPDWTSDGRLIYTKGPTFGPTRIFISDGGAERQLIPDATALVRPSYSDWQAVWLR